MLAAWQFRRRSLAKLTITLGASLSGGGYTPVADNDSELRVEVASLVRGRSLRFFSATSGHRCARCEFVSDTCAAVWVLCPLVTQRPRIARPPPL